jgi:hypothetical protein
MKACTMVIGIEPFLFEGENNTSAVSLSQMLSGFITGILGFISELAR